MKSDDKVEFQLEYFEKHAKSNRYDCISSRTINEHLLGISYTGRHFITQTVCNHSIFLKFHTFIETTKQYEHREPYDTEFRPITSMLGTIDETLI